MSELRRFLPVLLLFLLLSGCATLGGAKTQLVTGEVLKAMGEQFLQTHMMLTQLHNMDRVDNSKYDDWISFAREFQTLFPAAVSLWEATNGQDLDSVDVILRLKDRLLAYYAFGTTLSAPGASPGAATEQPGRDPSHWRHPSDPPDPHFDGPDERQFDARGRSASPRASYLSTQVPEPGDSGPPPLKPAVTVSEGKQGTYITLLYHDAFPAWEDLHSIANDFACRWVKKTPAVVEFYHYTVGMAGRWPIKRFSHRIETCAGSD